MDREAHNRYYRQKLYCTFCDSYITRSGFSTHKKSKKHKENIEKFRKQRKELQGEDSDEENMKITLD